MNYQYQNRGQVQIKEREALWRPRQESNLYLALRRRSFYPLNYGGKGGSLRLLMVVRLLDHGDAHEELTYA